MNLNQELVKEGRYWRYQAMD